MKFLVIKNFLSEAYCKPYNDKKIRKTKSNRLVVKKDNWVDYSPEEKTNNLHKPTF